MRTRSKVGLNCPIFEIYRYKWSNPGGAGNIPLTVIEDYHDPIRYWAVPNGFPSTSEEFQDETGNDSNFRNCYHTFEANEFAADGRDCCYPLTWHGNAYVRNITVDHIAASLGTRVAPDIDMQAMADEAVAFMSPRLDEGNSLVNFVLELKDLKHMNPFPTIHRLTRRHLPLKALSDRRTRKEFTKELTTRLVDAHLNASFGIVPFVGDLVKMHDDLMSLAFRLEQLKQHVGQRLQRHYKRVIPETPGQSPSRDWTYHDHPTISWGDGDITDDWTEPFGLRTRIRLNTRSRWIIRPVYHATMRYSYTLPELDSQLEKVYAYLDALGVNLDPSIVWNAIPFSFVVDWVIDVSGYLSSFARMNYPINVTVHDFCHSYGWHKECELRCSYDGDINLAEVGWPKIDRHVYLVRAYRGVRTYYNRVVLKTHNIPSIRVRGPRLRQAALAGSLLLSRTSLASARRYRDLSRLPNLGTNR